MCNNYVNSETIPVRNSQNEIPGALFRLNLKSCYLLNAIVSE